MRFPPLLLLLLAAACGGDAGADAGAPPATEVPGLPMETLGGFDYEERMQLPEDVTAWNGRRVRATGFINPGRQVRDLASFDLVKDRASCCFGQRPKINHYVHVTLKAGATTNFSPDPVTVEGVLVVEDRWDGDWPLGLYWMEGAEVVE